MPNDSPKSKAGRSGWLPGILRRHIRFNISALLFVILAVALSVGGVGPARSVLLAFSISAVVFLAAIVRLFSGVNTAAIRKRAREEDQGRWHVLWSGVAVSMIALVALAVELHADKGSGNGLMGIVLAAVSLMLSWLFLNTIFALHYAHEYYGDNDRRQQRGGLKFPQDDNPDYWDFVYFSFVLGMTFQVSDVEVTNRGMRRIALVHGVVAFFFNVVIVALSVNVVAGQA